MKKKMKKKKFRFSKFKVIRNFTVIGIILLLLFSVKSHAYNQNTFKTIIVSEGQTLWEIAKSEKVNNCYYQNKDIREIVKEIKKYNGLNSSTIYVNQKIQIIEK